MNLSFAMAEKRYRFPQRKGLFGLFRKYSSLFYAFAAWNVLGYVIYKSVDSYKRKTDDSWDEKNSTEKYLSQLNFGTDRSNMERIKIKGFTIQSRQTEEKAKSEEL